jgi:YesN/AraC family two-component response regulator
VEHFKLNQSMYSLVISDLRMPVINGIQLLKTAKDLNPQVRTVLMTVFGEGIAYSRNTLKKKS